MFEYSCEDDIKVANSVLFAVALFWSSDLSIYGILPQLTFDKTLAVCFADCILIFYCLCFSMF